MLYRERSGAHGLGVDGCGSPDRFRYSRLKEAVFGMLTLWILNDGDGGGGQWEHVKP
jgi:hypothetical protein